MKKTAYSTALTYEISDAEKMQAERAFIYFNGTSKLLDKAADYLNIMKTPFKDSQDMTPEVIMQARSSIRQFRDKVIENFNDFKIASFKCVHIMQNFASDTQTIKIMKSFISSIDDLEKQVNLFVNLFDNLQDPDFIKNVISIIEDIQKSCQELNELIDDRIKNHIQTNILAKSWVDSISSDLQMKIEQKTPLILDLFNKRQDKLNEMLKEKE